MCSANRHIKSELDTGLLLQLVSQNVTQIAQTAVSVHGLNKILHVISHILCHYRKKKMEKSRAPSHRHKTSLSSQALDRGRSTKSPSVPSRTTPEDPKRPKRSLPVSFTKPNTYLLSWWLMGRDTGL